MTPEEIVKEQYRRCFGRELNLDTPVSLNEKIQWLKINDQSELRTLQADKYKMRDFVNSLGLSHYLNNMLLATSNLEELLAVWHSLPQQFVVKANHWSGHVYIVKDRDKYSLSTLSPLKAALKLKYGQDKGELQYRDIVPRIVVEQYLENKDSTPISDYRLWCFNGTPLMMQVDLNRAAKDYYARYFYAVPDWKKINLSYNIPQGAGELSRPECLDEVIEASTELSNDSKLMRVDWFIVDGNPVLGELTHTPVSGVAKWIPEEADKELGGLLAL